MAVTDHNSGGWIDKLNEALAEMEEERPVGFRPLHLFPGVELSVNGGFHLLAVFGPQTRTADIDTLLGAVSYEGTRGHSDGVTRKSAVEVVETVLSAGGIPIPAHVDQKKGLLRLKTHSGRTPEIDSTTVAQVLEVEGILAMETFDPGSGKPGVYRQLNTVWTEVVGSDFHPPYRADTDRFPGSHYTWVKMAGPPSLDGLRLALLDGNRFSIRRCDGEPLDPFAVPHYFIESIQIGDARYMGRGQPAGLRFSPLLNAIVGGRGTGKSTIIHALRLATRRDGDILRLKKGSIPRSTFERFNRVYKNRADDGALKDGTAIHWTVVRDGIRHRVTWRRGDNAATIRVEDEAPDAEWVESSSQSVGPSRFPVRIFSQGQIAELAGESRPALLPLIDEAAGASRLHSQLDESTNRYFTSRARIRELEGQLARADEVAVGLEDVGRKLKQFETSDHSAVLRAYRARVRQEREADRQFAGVGDAARRVADLANEIELESLPEGMAIGESEADGDFRLVIRALGAAVDTATDELRNTAARLREASEKHQETLSGSSWQEALDWAKADYQHLVRELVSAGVSDPAEYGKLVQERQRLTEQREVLESKREERIRRVKESEECHRQIQAARRTISEGRERFLEQALAQNDFVRISVQRYGDDARTIERSLRDELGVKDDRFEPDILKYESGRAKGIVGELLHNLPIDAVERGTELERRLERLKQRWESACRGEGGFGGHFNNYLERESERDPTLLDRLWAWFPEDGLNVEYSRRSDGKDFRPIGQASAGQRAAAMLAFLLAYGAEPLVLDQPEDDLDNHLIYDLVVRQIRENKLRRQIIVVTHNPNIVVNGDAEMLHAMEFKAGQCVVSQAGSLQDQDIRDEICRVMEGGREAFESRYRRLGPESARA
ncbi:MAG: AAA family ATPase [Gemmatimonadetes bacterium]|nr:AAA family ATPase [Gemmatimonadota bacterium]